MDLEPKEGLDPKVEPKDGPKEDLEQKLNDYTQEVLKKTSLTERELKAFFDSYLSSVFLDSGKQPKFENDCIRYARYEDELTDYTRKCLALFGIDLDLSLIHI